MLDIVFADLANYHKALLEQSLRTHHSQSNLGLSNLSQSNLGELSHSMPGGGGGGGGGASSGSQWQQGQWVNQDSNDADALTQRPGYNGSSSSGSSSIADQGLPDSTAAQTSVASFATPLKPSRSFREFSMLPSTSTAAGGGTGGWSGSSSSNASQVSINETRITQTQGKGRAKGVGSFVTVGRMSHLKVTVMVVVIVLVIVRSGSDSDREEW